MKKIFVSTLMIISIGLSSFAKDPTTVGIRVSSTFNREFSKAEHVRWTVFQSFAWADFMLNNEKVTAYFNLDGEYLGLGRLTKVEDLPTHFKRSFSKRFADYTVQEAIWFTGAGMDAYFISAENKEKSIVLQMYDGVISIAQRKNKN